MQKAERRMTPPTEGEKSYYYNKVELLGKLLREPELRFTAKGIPVCRFHIVVNRYYRDATGNLQKEAIYVPIVSWRKVAEFCGEKLKKGDLVYIVGQLRTRSYKIKDEEERTVLEIEAYSIEKLAKMPKKITLQEELK
jgi:single-strand DNA-binding protein